MKGFTVTIPAVTTDYALAINEAAGLVASGTGTADAAYAAGATTITINGLTASKVLKAGAIIRLPGHNTAYITSADVTASADGVLSSVALLPASGLERGIAAGSPVLVEQVKIPIDSGTASGVYQGNTQFTIAGDATVYRLVNPVTATAGGDLGAVLIQPPLASAPADNAVVTALPPTLTDGADGYESTVTFNVTGIAGGTVLTPEGTIDGTNWFGLGITPTTSTTMATTLNANGAWRMQTSGCTQTRLRVTTAGTGTVTVAAAPTVG